MLKILLFTLKQDFSMSAFYFHLSNNYKVTFRFYSTIVTILSTCQ